MCILKNILKKIPLAFLFVLIPVNTISAYSDDSADMPIRSTVVMGVESYPQNNKDFLYEEFDVNGWDTPYLVEYLTWSQIYDVVPDRRLFNVDRVAGPPGTKINFIFFFSNLLNDPIEIEGVRVSLSRANEVGNFTKMVDISGYDTNPIHTIHGNINLIDNGIGKTYMKNFHANTEYMKYAILDTFEIKNPVEISSYKITPDYENSLAYVDVKVKNTSEKELNNIEFKHGTYSFTQDVLPNSEVDYQYTLDLNEDEIINLGKIQIKNPNIHTECAVYGAPWFNYYSTNAISSYYLVEDTWYTGLHTQPEGESMCITRNAYTMFSEEIVYDPNASVEEINNDVKDSGEVVLQPSHSVVEQGDILGISHQMEELPKTVKYSITSLLYLLVGISLLWYSLFKLRRNYESKNTITRLCTKSSK